MQRLAEVNKEVNRTRKSLKKQYFATKFEECIGDLRATWETLGEAMSGRRGKKQGAVCPYFTSGGEVITDGEKIAKGFCKFYCQVRPKLAAQVPKEQHRVFGDFMGEAILDEFVLTPTTPQEVEELCLDLEAGKGMGWDEISPRVIKGVARELSGSLSRFYNSCMREGYYPTCFKVARVVPIFKSEDPTEFSNYRPVSVLPVLSQVFEKVIRSRLIRFFDKHLVPGNNSRAVWIQIRAFNSNGCS